jgi:hypothetical protein
MLVLAAISDVQVHKLRRAAGSRFSVAQAATWDEVLGAIRGRPVELAVVDPLLSGDARSQEIERLRVLFPSLPLILYTTLTPRTASVLLALGQRGIQHVVFANYDDHPNRLREVLGQEEARSSSRRLLDQLGDALAPLPSGAGCSRRRYGHRARFRPWVRWLYGRGWTDARASAGSRA